MTTKAMFEYIRQTAERTKVGNIWELRIDGRVVATEGPDGNMAVLVDAMEDLGAALVDEVTVDEALGETPPAKPQRPTRPVPKPGAKSPQPKATANGRATAGNKVKPITKREQARLDREAAAEKKRREDEKAEKKAERERLAEEKKQAREAAKLPNFAGLVSKDTKADSQYRLIDADAIELGQAGDPPSRRLVESVRLHGVQVPIKVIETEKGFEVIEGRRRVAAARQAGIKQIRATVDKRADINPHVLAIVLNADRGENVLDLYRHVSALMTEESLDKKGVMAATGLDKHQLNVALAPGNLNPALFAAVEAGDMPPSATLNASRLDPAEQDLLVALYKREGRITARDVSAVRSHKQHEAVATAAEGIDATPMPVSEGEVEQGLANDAAERVAGAVAPVGDLAKMSRVNKKALAVSKIKQALLVLESLTKPDDDEADALTFVREAIDRLTVPAS